MVQFRFYKPETEKTKPNPNKKNRKKPSQTGKNRAKLEIEPNRFEPVFSQNNQTEPKPVGLNWFGSVLVLFYKKNGFWLFFFDKNQTESKMIISRIQ